MVKTNRKDFIFKRNKQKSTLFVRFAIRSTMIILKSTNKFAREKELNNHKFTVLTHRFMFLRAWKEYIK